MLIDSISLFEGSNASNLTVSAGPSFPSTANVAELFYLTGSDPGLYIYDGSIWQQVPNADNPVLTGTVTIDGNVLPSVDDTYALGSAIYRFSNVYADTANLNKLTINDAPVVDTDATNKAYVDAAVTGLSWKNSVKVATTSSIALSGLQTIDGVTVIADDRVLVKNQTNGLENGIYTVTTGTWLRSLDANSTTEIRSAGVWVELGTSQGGTGWVSNASSVVGFSLGVHSFTFTQFNGASGITAGVGVDKSGNTMSVKLGAGITQLPTNEVGVDVRPTGGLFLTADGLTSSTNTGAQLSILLDGTTLTTSASGARLSTVGIADTYKSVTTDAYGRVIAGTNPTTLVGYGITDAQPLDSDLTALAALSTTGIVTRTAASTFVARSIVGSGVISVSNGNAISGNPTVTLNSVTNSATGTLQKITVDGYGRVTGNVTASQSDITSLLGTGSITNAMIANTAVTDLSGINTGDQTTITGNAGSATVLQTARTINDVSFDGSSNIVINAVDSTPRIASSEKGVANGVATLDATGLVPSTQLPSYVDDVVEGANLAAFPVTGETGKIYVALDTNKSYRWSGSTYVYITSGAVDSVAGKTGVVTLVKADVGLSNVDNTSDANKPVSTAQQTALNLKANIASPGLTGVPTAPTAAVSTNTTQIATTAYVMAEIASDAAPITHVGSGGVEHAAVTTTVNGFMLAADKAKLDAIAEGANVYTLPVATASVLGGVKDGAGVTIAGDGTLSAAVLSVAGKTGAVTLAAADVSGVQPLDNDLTSIAALAGTSGFLKKTAADTWTLDTSSYITAETDTLATVTGRGATTSSAITVSNATASTSTTSGALIVSGGVGIASNLSVGTNVGIGTAAPNVAGFNFLDIAGHATNGGGVRIFNSSKNASVTFTVDPAGNTTKFSVNPSMNIVFGNTFEKIWMNTASGWLGIGASPTCALDVQVQAPRLRLFATNGTNASVVQYQNDSGTAYTGIDGFGGTVSGTNNALLLWQNSTNPIILGVGNVERFRIGAVGQLGIAGANYGTAGQVLTSGGPSTATSWTSITTALGFTPVQQGGGTGQGTNKVYIGWNTTTSQMNLQVDTTNYAGSWPINVTGSAASATTATTATNLSGGSISTGVNTSHVGTAGPSNTVFVSDQFAAAAVSFNRSGVYAINMGLDTDNVFRLGGYSQGASVYRWSSDTAGNFTASGNVTAYSDARLKTDIAIIDKPVEKVLQLNGYTYTRTDSGERQTGVIAQELQKVLPEAVNDTGEYLTVAYGNVVGLLIEAIKELKREIEELKTR